VLNVDQKIELFKSRVLEWQLGIADQIANGDPATGRPAIPHSGFAVLSIVVNYFEIIGKFRLGYDSTGMSERHFDVGARDVLEKVTDVRIEWFDRIIERLYEPIRCGLYHAGMTGWGVSLSGDPLKPFNVNRDGTLIVNPHKLVKVLIQHFGLYVNELTDATNISLRTNFERRFDFEAFEAGVVPACGSGPYARRY